jgi:hypothetical protein
VVLLTRRAARPAAGRAARTRAVIARVLGVALFVYSFAVLAVLLSYPLLFVDGLLKRSELPALDDLTRGYGWASPSLLGLALCPIALFAVARSIEDGRAEAVRIWSRTLVAAGLVGLTAGFVLVQDTRLEGDVLVRMAIVTLVHHNPPLTDAFRTTVHVVAMGAWALVAIVGAIVSGGGEAPAAGEGAVDEVEAAPFED